MKGDLIFLGIYLKTEKTKSISKEETNGGCSLIEFQLQNQYFGIDGDGAFVRPDVSYPNFSRLTTIKLEPK